MRYLLCSFLFLALSPLTVRFPPPDFRLTSIINAAHASPSLEKAETYLNAITTLRADFAQIAPDGGFARGELLLDRPGKMRWDYADPTPILMLADGDTLIYIDEEMEEVTYLDIDDTLAAIIVQPKIDFEDPSLLVSDVRDEAGLLRLTLRRAQDREDGALTLVFKTAPMQLYQFEIENETGDVTIVTLENIRRGEHFDDALFTHRRTLLITK